MQDARHSLKRQAASLRARATEARRVAAVLSIHEERDRLHAEAAEDDAAALRLEELADQQATPVRRPRSP